jgi:hypothetical protein
MKSGRERGRLIRELSGREVHNLLLDELVRIPLWPRLNEPNCKYTFRLNQVY